MCVDAEAFPGQDSTGPLTVTEALEFAEEQVLAAWFDYYGSDNWVVKGNGSLRIWPAW